MIKKCHGLDIELECSLKTNTNCISCHVRNIEIPLTPEEEVRQAVLKAIFNHMNIDMQQFITRVEFQCLDIAFYYRYPITNFQPSQYPFLIIETKRDFTNLLNHVSQITKYLELNYCPIGLLLTSQVIFKLSKETNYDPIKIQFKDVCAIFCNKKFTVHEDVTDFQNAVNGDIDAFKRLTLKFSQNSRIKFLCYDYEAPITAFLFDFKQDHILFDICGAKARAKKHKIKLESFVKLISITEI